MEKRDDIIFVNLPRKYFVKFSNLNRANVDHHKSRVNNVEWALCRLNLKCYF